MFLIAKNKSPPILECYVSVYKDIMTISESCKICSNSILQFTNKLYEMWILVIPENQFQIEQITNLFIQLAEANYQLSNSLKHVSDDIRDVVERFIIVSRKEEKFNEVRDEYISASDELIGKMAEKKTLEKRTDYYKYQASIEEKIKQAKEEQNRINLLLRKKRKV